MAKVLALGEALIDFIPLQKGVPLKDVTSFERAPGGAPANVAAAVARLGGQSRFIGKLGADPFGDFLVETLQRAGVDVSCIRRTGEARTGLAFVSLRADGERDFSFYRDPSADMLLGPEELDRSWFEPGDILHHGSISLIQEPSRSATLQAVAMARAAGGLISYDPNLRLPLWPSAEEARERILAALPEADLVKLSDEELHFLTGDEGVWALFTGRVKAICITRGARGSELYTRSGRVVAPGYRVEAVDTTGAGDGFVGGLLYLLAQRRIGPDRLEGYLSQPGEALEMLRFANGCGALTSTRKGAISALPDLAEVRALMASQPARG